MQPDAGDPLPLRRHGPRHRARPAPQASQVRLRLMTHAATGRSTSPNGDVRQPPRTDAELARWADFVARRACSTSTARSDYVEVWNEPNAQKYWPTGPDPVEFTRLLATTYDVVKHGRARHPGDQRRTQRQRHRLPRARCTRPRTRSGWRPPLRHARGAPVQPARPRPTRSTRPSVYERDPYGLFDANFTGFAALHDVMVDQRRRRPARLHHPVRLLRPGSPTDRAGARRDPGAAT